MGALLPPSQYQGVIGLLVALAGIVLKRGLLSTLIPSRLYPASAFLIIRAPIRFIHLLPPPAFGSVSWRIFPVCASLALVAPAEAVLHPSSRHNPYYCHPHLHCHFRHDS